MAKSPLNGSGKRKLASWIDGFVDFSSNHESAILFRRWTAISVIAAALERKVYLKTSHELYPNLYIFLVGHAGVGKTRTIMEGAKLYREIPEPLLSPTSMTAASLIDALTVRKRQLIRLPDPPLEYNTMYICADELSAFMHKYDTEMVGNLTTLYDGYIPYSQERRGKEIKIKIANPQLNIISGTTPSNLVSTLPEGSWEQGFMTRTIMVFSDERIISDDIFANKSVAGRDDLVHDLRTIASIAGPFSVTQHYKDAINNWRKLGQPPVPTHPKLIHYNARRLTHLFKLSMVSAIDRSNTLVLDKDDFNRAMGWLLEVEQDMPEIFKAGSIGADSKAMDEVVHHCMLLDKGQGVAEPVLVRRARELVPAHSVMRVIEILERSGMIRTAKVVKGVRYFSVGKIES